MCFISIYLCARLSRSPLPLPSSTSSLRDMFELRAWIEFAYSRGLVGTRKAMIGESVSPHLSWLHNWLAGFILYIYLFIYSWTSTKYKIQSDPFLEFTFLSYFIVAFIAVVGVVHFCVALHHYFFFSNYVFHFYLLSGNRHDKDANAN